MHLKPYVFLAGCKYTESGVHCMIYNVRVPQGVGKGNENTPVKLKKTRTRYGYETHVALTRDKKKYV